MSAPSSEKITYKSVGRCIYCNRRSTSLSNEHIIAEAIGGNWILPKSSCKRCQEKTKKLEGHCFGGTIKAFRLYMGMQGKRKDKAKQFPIRLRFPDGHEETVQIPIETYPAILVLPYPKATPTVLEKPTGDPDTLFDSWGLTINGETLKNYPEGTRVGGAPLHIGNWLRMIAKIAHSYTVAELGVDGFRPLLTSIILGHDRCFSHYIGARSSEIPSAAKSYHHSVDIGECHTGTIPGKRYVYALVRLFACFGAPEFFLVVGEVK